MDRFVFVWGIALFSFFCWNGEEFHPLGPDRIAHETATYNQRIPALACDYSGNFILVWTNGDAWARRFQRGGSPIGDAFRVNTLTEYTQDDVAVAMNWSGRCVIAWSDWHGYDGSNMGVFARIFDSSGLAQGTDFSVPSITQGSQFQPHISMASDGDFVVTWSDSYAANSFGRCFESSGNALGDQFLINSDTVGFQLYPAVAMHNEGGFFVSAFEDASGLDGDRRGIFARLFTFPGLPLGENFQVNNLNTYESQTVPRVAMDGSGRFIVVWEEHGEADGDGKGIFARLFAPDGLPLGDEFQCNQQYSGNQITPEIAADFAGNFIITWNDDSGVGGEIRGRRFDRTGSPLCDEFNVNSIQSGNQQRPVVASDQAGEEMIFVFEGPGDDLDIYYRLFHFHPILLCSNPGRGLMPSSRNANLSSSPSPGITAQALGTSRQIALDLHFPGSSGLNYQLYLALGTSPGQELPDGRHLFLNNDSLFQFFSLNPGARGLSGFQGTLDAEGRGRAFIHIPADSSWLHWKVFVAALTWDPNVALSEGLRTATDPVAIHAGSAEVISGEY